MCLRNTINSLFEQRDCKTLLYRTCFHLSPGKTNVRGGRCKSYLICKMYPNWLYRRQQSDQKKHCVFFMKADKRRWLLAVFPCIEYSVEFLKTRKILVWQRYDKKLNRSSGWVVCLSGTDRRMCTTRSARVRGFLRMRWQWCKVMCEHDEMSGRGSSLTRRLDKVINQIAEIWAICMTCKD